MRDSEESKGCFRQRLTGTSPRMLIGYFQFQPVFGEPGANCARMATALRGCQADLLVLPELCTTGYQFVSQEETLALAEPFPHGPHVQFFQKLAEDTGMALVAGFAERDGDACYNSTALFPAMGQPVLYRKAHLFYEETLWFLPGSTPFPVVNVGSAKVGLMICFDWFFPEAARTLALKGADIIAHPANLVLPYCRDMMRTRAFENRVFTITANRYGTEERGGKAPLTFTGESQILSPKGEVLARSPGEEDCLSIIDIDPAEAQNKQLNPYNDLFRQRRPDLYGVTSDDK